MMAVPWRETLAVAALHACLLTPVGGATETIQHGELEDDADEGAEADAGDDESGQKGEGGDEGADDGETIDHGELEGGEEADGDSESGAAGVPSGSTSFAGRWASGIAVDTGWEGGGEDVVEMDNALSFQLEQPFGERWKVRAEAQFEHWMGGKRNEGGADLLVNADEPRAAAEFRLGESYLLYQGDRWTFRAGHLVTSWGRTSLFRPAAVVNARDFRGGLQPGGSGRTVRPQPSVEIGYVQPNWQLEGVLVPFFTPHRVTLFGRDTAAVATGNTGAGDTFPPLQAAESLLDPSLYEEAQPLLLAREQPDELPGNASGGIRLTGTRWNTDFGAGVYLGWDRTPTLRLDEDLRRLVRLAVEDGRVLRDFDLQGFLERNPEAAELGRRVATKRARGRRLYRSYYERRHTLVLDAARYVGPVGVRFDATFSPARTFLTRSLASVRRPSVETALGLSWERLVEGRPLTVTVEGTWLHPFGADSAPTRWFVPASRRGNGDREIAMFGRNWWAVAGAFDWALPWWDLRAQTGAFADLANGGWVGRAEISRRWASWLETGVRGVVFEGPSGTDDLSIGGLYDRNDRVGLFARGEF